MPPLLIDVALAEHGTCNQQEPTHQQLSPPSTSGESLPVWLSPRDAALREFNWVKKKRSPHKA